MSRRFSNSVSVPGGMSVDAAVSSLSSKCSNAVVVYIQRIPLTLSQWLSTPNQTQFTLKSTRAAANAMRLCYKHWICSVDFATQGPFRMLAGGSTAITTSVLYIHKKERLEGTDISGIRSRPPQSMTPQHSEGMLLTFLSC